MISRSEAGTSRAGIRCQIVPDGKNAHARAAADILNEFVTDYPGCRGVSARIGDGMFVDIYQQHV
ncbi:MAG: hypothetical protein VYE18_07700 [Pseudomonadota bacterium]|nr:hypothetical protein [Pseudomonadota bacterium]